MKEFISRREGVVSLKNALDQGKIPPSKFHLSLASLNIPSEKQYVEICKILVRFKVVGAE